MFCRPTSGGDGIFSILSVRIRVGCFGPMWGEDKHLRNTVDLRYITKIIFSIHVRRRFGVRRSGRIFFSVFLLSSGFVSGFDVFDTEFSVKEYMLQKC
jgi:hypothetical protein